MNGLRICYLGRIGYAEALAIQEKLVELRQSGLIEDTLLILEHPDVLTLGIRGQEEHIFLSREELAARGVEVFATNRGGDVTYHGPGQIVVYPIFRLVDFSGGIHQFIHLLEQAIINLLAERFLLQAEAKSGKMTGLWIGERKIMAIGIAVRHGVSMHGCAFNVNTDLRRFKWINPCGLSMGVTSLAEEIGHELDLAVINELVGQYLAQAFGVQAEVITQDKLFGVQLEKEPESRLLMPKPPWLHVHAAADEISERTRQILRGLDLHSVCEQAGCPNRTECFGRATAAFLIMGSICSRNCRFCQIESGIPTELDLLEPDHLAEAVTKLKLRHVVITSVTRDDLPDGGAEHFAAVVRAIRNHCGDPAPVVEVLIPDFNGNWDALWTVVQAEPDIINHNVETVPRLYASVRPQANYRRSLELLAQAKRLRPVTITKSGLMLGLGETRDEVLATMSDLRSSECDLLTVGQYLAPSRQHLPVIEYVHPDVFERYREQAEKLGFSAVAAGPLVRSSYMADHLAATIMNNKESDLEVES